MPSAEEMSQGVMLTWMQIRLLEKIEELTLHTIEQQEMLAKLETANDELRLRLTAVESR